MLGPKYTINQYLLSYVGIDHEGRASWSAVRLQNSKVLIIRQLTTVFDGLWFK